MEPARTTKNVILSDRVRKTLRVFVSQNERWLHIMISASQVTRWSVHNMESARTTKNVILPSKKRGCPTKN